MHYVHYMCIHASENISSNWNLCFKVFIIVFIVTKYVSIVFYCAVVEQIKFVKITCTQMK